MNRQRFLTWVLVGLVGLAFAPSVDAGWWDDLSDAKPVKLEDLIKDPHGWKGKEVTFVCVFHKVSTIFNPYYTRFVPSEYVNFSAWPLSKKLWVKEDYLGSHKFLFLEKDHKHYDELMKLTKFTRLKLTGYVQSTFKESPWIEVRRIEVLSGAITKAALKEIILGDRAAAREDWDAAMAHYNRAAAMDLPEEVLASVSKKRASTYHNMGQTENARVALQPALEYDPKDEEAAALLADIRKGVEPPALKPAKLESTEEDVTAKSVDPEKYTEEPKALPVPEAQPAVEEPGTVEAAEQPDGTQPPVEDEPAVETPVVEEPAVEQPVVEEPVVEEPAKAEPEKTEPPKKPKVEDEPVHKKGTPKKRMAGPM